MSEKAAVRIREKWVDDVKVIACIHNADFSDAYALCSTDEICFVEGWHRKRCDSCSTGTWNQLCKSDYSCMDYEENKVVGVLFVSE